MVVEALAWAGPKEATTFARRWAERAGRVAVLGLFGLVMGLGAVSR